MAPARRGAHDQRKKMVSPLARREQLAFVRARGLSLRRACGLIDMSRATPSYELRLPAKDAPVLAAMKALSAQYPRYGYRRIRVFLRRSGFELSWSRTHRLWRQAGLLVPRKRPRKRIASVRPRIHTPFKANMVWAYDFVFDTTASGQQIGESGCRPEWPQPTSRRPTRGSPQSSAPL